MRRRRDTVNDADLRATRVAISDARSYPYAIITRRSAHHGGGWELHLLEDTETKAVWAEYAEVLRHSGQFAEVHFTTANFWTEEGRSLGR